MDRDKLEKALQHVGGRFKLIVLFQKRLRQLQKSDLGTAGYDINTLQDMILDEILQGKIQLESEEKEK